MEQAEKGTYEYFQKVGAIKNGHFELTNQYHSDTFIAKRIAFRDTERTKQLCAGIASAFPRDVETVIGAATGSIVIANWTAYILSRWRGRMINFIYADKLPDGSFRVNDWDIEAIKGKRLLSVDDIMTSKSGGTLEKIVKLVRANQGEVVGAAGIWNRGGITADDLDVPKFHAEINVSLPAWPKETCPLCERGEMVIKT